MLKHIIGQSIFQLSVLLILVFYGETFIPEEVDALDRSTFLNLPQHKWHNGVVGGTVRSGRLHTISGRDDYRPIF
jgi:hypothetical protein